ncbi:hypothetical protein ABZU32_27925 [Sphaerisporangium sp. NPDC005288]|uniref:hypothetical protein n=1 Tax=Sphaerisporangium sp. NPDC005288 TaxID=3155114 RepID=UPI0033A5BEE0
MTPPTGVRERPEVERLADRIAQAVEGCPDVASLAGGPVATYLAGRTVAGIAVRDAEVEVAVVVRYGRPLTEVAAEVRSAVEPLVPGLPVHVRIDDITLPGQEALTGEESAAPPAARADAAPEETARPAKGEAHRPAGKADGPAGDEGGRSAQGEADHAAGAGGGRRRAPPRSDRSETGEGERDG